MESGFKGRIMENEEKESFDLLIQEFTRLDLQEQVPPTFLEISGYPHYENVISNILAFYIEQNPQGIGLCLLSSIFDVLGETVSDYEEIEVKEVNRELPTSNNKRIDIVIETNQYLIAIENKIWHKIDNPFEEYVHHIKQLIGESEEEKESKFILLTLKKKNYSKKELIDFKQISYEELFKALEKRLSEVETNNYEEDFAKYLIFIKDLIQTVRNMSQINLSEDFTNYIRVNQKKLNSMKAEVFVKFEKFIKNQFNQIDQHLKNEIDKELAEKFNTSSSIKKDRMEGVMFFRFDELTVFDGEEINLTLKLRLRPDGWFVEIWDSDKDKIIILKRFLNEIVRVESLRENHLFDNTKDKNPKRRSFVCEEFELKSHTYEIVNCLSQNYLKKIIQL